MPEIASPENTEPDTATDVEVHGYVQGVGYRWSCQVEARRLGVRGWIRNDPGGTVSGHFEGAGADVEALVEWCRQGPPGSRVTSVETQPAQQEGRSRFTVLS